MLPETSQDVVDRIYQIMDEILCLFDELAIDYRIIGGTLLGAIRHQGLIPWDDDVDFVIRQQEAEKVEAALMVRNWRWSNIRATFEWGTYMFSQASGRKLPAWENVSYPYCDVLPMIRDQGRLVYRYSEIRKTFPNDFIFEHEWDSHQLYSFGPFHLKGPRMDHARRYLDDAYGSNWEHEAFVTFDKINCKPVDRIVHQLPTMTAALPSQDVCQTLRMRT